MSNVLAIANVTAALAQVLTEALPSSGVGGATVTFLRPDDTSDLAVSGRVNIFLYQVSPNPYLRNADLPTRKSDGTLIKRPQAAIDLHYLLTFYGDDTSLDQQRLLGSVVRQLHAQPALRHSDIVSAQTNHAFLSASDLADQVELIRFTPVNFSLEELSKLWSVFLKTDYVLSVAYMASVVLIETDDLPPASALPVLKPCLTAVPFSLTVIDSVDPQAVDLLSPPGASQISLVGQGLDPGDSVTFLTPGNPDPIAGTILSGQPDLSQLLVELPGGLRPGVNTVTLGTFSTPSSPLGQPLTIIAQSNAAAFMLRPSASFLTSSPPGQVIASISPEPGPAQLVILLLNQVESSPPGPAPGFQLTGVADATQPGVYNFVTTVPSTDPNLVVSVPSGIYLARVRVDTAESPLSVDPSGTFNGPIVTIP